MRAEIKNWWEQALEDLDTAKVTLEGKKYYASVFFCQQAVEKALKALYILKIKEAPGTTHSLIFLANRLDIPQNFFSLLKKLTPEFVTTRYPDVVGEVPYRLYDQNIAKEFFKESKELITWIESQITKQ